MKPRLLRIDGSPKPHARQLEVTVATAAEALDRLEAGSDDLVVTDAETLVRLAELVLERRRPSGEDARSVSATEAKNQFAQLLETASREGRVYITKHDVPKAALVSIEELRALGSRPSRLGALSDRFDAMLEKMQAPGVRGCMQNAFDASPEELGKAALNAARGRG